METIVKKWGNSLGLRLPMNMAKELNITDGSKVELTQKNGKIIITSHEFDMTISQLTEGMTKSGVMDQFSDYPSFGNEEDI